MNSRSYTSRSMNALWPIMSPRSRVVSIALRWRRLWQRHDTSECHEQHNEAEQLSDARAGVLTTSRASRMRPQTAASSGWKIPNEYGMLMSTWGRRMTTVRPRCWNGLMKLTTCSRAAVIDIAAAARSAALLSFFYRPQNDTRIPYVQ